MNTILLATAIGKSAPVALIAFLGLAAVIGDKLSG